MTRRAPAEFVALQASGSYWAQPGQVARRLARLRGIDPDVALIILTEVTAAQYAEIIAVPGWKAAKVGEIVVTWRAGTFAARWRVLTTILSLIVFFTGKGGRKDGVTAGSVRLRHRSTRRRGIVRGAHFPSSVQDGPGWSNKEPRVNAHQDATDDAGDRTRRLKRRRPHWFQLLGADFNVDMHLQVWRDRLERDLSLRCCWRPGRIPGRGTHGRRLIDALFHFGLELIDAWVVDGGDPAHDHGVAAARYRIHPRRRTRR